MEVWLFNSAQFPYLEIIIVESFDEIDLQGCKRMWFSWFRFPYLKILTQMYAASPG